MTKLNDWLDGRRVIAIETWTMANPRSIFTDTYVKMIDGDGKTLVVKWDEEVAKAVEINPLNWTLVRSKDGDGVECDRHSDGGTDQPPSS